MFGSLTRQLEDLNEQSSVIQQQLMMSPMSGYLREQDQKIREELLKLYRDEELFWAQRAKANWLMLGDKNMRFFQTQANIRRKSNYISKIEVNAGNWATSENDIAEVSLQDFKKSFHMNSAPSHNALHDFLSVIDPCIDNNDNISLLKQITDEEIWDAVKAIGALKAPGPDGLHTSFFQNC